MSNPNSEQFYSQRFVDHLEYSKDSPFVPCIISTALSLPPPGDHLPTHNHTHMSPTGISSHIAYKHADLFSIDLHLEEGAAQDGGFPFITRIFSYTCSTRGPWPCNTHAIRPQHLFPALVNGEERGGRIAFLRNAYKHSHNVHPKDRKMLHTIIPCVHLLLSIGIALSTSMNLSCHRAGVIQITAAALDAVTATPSDVQTRLRTPIRTHVSSTLNCSSTARAVDRSSHAWHDSRARPRVAEYEPIRIS